jgi:endonuclease III
MIQRRGIIAAAERAVNKKGDAMGFKRLVEMGLHDLTFEAVIISHPDKFSQEVVARAKERLEKLKKHSHVGGIESIIGANSSIAGAEDSRALDCQQGEIGSLRDVSRLLAAKRPFMFSFMDRYIFSQIQVPRQESLESLANFMKIIDFCLKTRQRVNRKDFDQSQKYFADNFKETKENIISGNWPETLRLIYGARGVGQKIGSLILEALIHYGKANDDLEPQLFVPIDTHVRRIFTECLGLTNVPSIGSPVSSSDYRGFQQFLADNTDQGTPRIYFDYLWFVGKVFCRKITENDEVYSKGYRLCSMCWIKDYCSFPDKWFTG